MNLGKFVNRKQSTETHVTDFCIGIDGFIIFSFLHIKLESGPTDSCLILFNRAVWERNTE